MPTMISEYLLAKADLANIPIEGTFELTPLCNMRCRMCYVRLDPPNVQKEGGLKTANEWMQIAKQAYDAGTLFLLLTGGEPLLHPEFEEIYVRLKNMGFTLAVNTNGTLFNEHYIELFKAYPPRRINITLYGFSSKTYEELCGYADGFEKTVHTILRLKEEGINVCIHFMATKDNIDDIPTVAQFAIDHDIDVEASSYIFKVVRCEREYENRLDANVAAAVSLFFNKMKYNDPDLNIIPQNYENLKSAHVSADTACKMNCRAGVSSYWITWNGRMTACGMMPFPSANVCELTFEECWSHVSKKVKKIRLPEACGVCENRAVCQVCPAKAYSENGNLVEKPDYVCDITESMDTLIRQ